MSKNAKHYLPDGKLYKGKVHKEGGVLMTGEKHTAKSRNLTHTPPKKVKQMKSPTWQTKAGQNPKGGLNAKGRSSYNAETGGNLKPPVKSGDNPRRASFLARMGNNAGAEYKDGEPTRLLLSLKAWGASSKADAKAKAKSISERNKAKAK